MKLIYIANARIPSEKAHPYQIVQMCEAFSQTGATVTLLYADRHTKPEFRVTKIHDFYGVSHSFDSETVPCIDVYPWAERLPRPLGRLWTRFAALLATLTFNLVLLRRIAQTDPSDVLYSRDPLSLALIAVRWPRRARQLAFEAHTFPATTIGLWLRRWLARRIGCWVVITQHLRDRYLTLGVPSNRLLVAHDGFREARFALTATRADCRASIGWPQDAFIVGYMGRFHTLGMDKGVSDLVDAIIALAQDGGTPQVRLGLVGGPDSYISALRARFAEAGLSEEILLYAGQVPAADVPRYLRAFDICAMPFPWTEHFAYYASPMKLFEYMASGSAIVATDLPSTAEILRDGENGLLVPPSDTAALIDVLRRLHDDPSLAIWLAEAARRDVQAYSWAARARMILQFHEDLTREGQ